MTKEMVCILCPNSCNLIVTQSDKNPDGLKVENALCPKGKEYAHNELFNPKRTIASSILVEEGELPLVSVKIDKPIPKSKIFEVMKEIKKAKVKAPVKIGDILIKNVAGTDANVIATKSVDKI
ncbi:MAG: DUF1667 domain-containing protein [Synergistetes bacterium]|nr:MAG: hypothetical protein XD52_0924 [bacterium 42_11]MBC7331959.1 DUF1667 domain-containing protein [Synergistota bacterium]MDK2871110.1 hypothetical protein [bacterium]